ncbi:MAG: NTP transferase domain-containing protein [Burkholderiales bacterium]
MNIIGLLLAAGSASRFGSDKLRHRLPHGVPIAVQAARNLKTSVTRVLAAVRAPEMRALFSAEECDTALCERAHEGMGASLACAVRAAGKTDAYIVALADMPFVRPSTIAAVREALENGAALAAPYFRARRGHPVGIAGRFYDELIALSGDDGARHLLAAHERELVKIPVGDPGVIRDIDRPEDLTPPIRA